MNTSHPLDLLTAARPTDDSLETTWTGSRSEASLASMQRLAESDGKQAHATRMSPRRRSARRWVALGAAAAVAAVALSIAPTVLSDKTGDSASAASQLVTSARLSTSPVIPDGKFLHMVVQQDQSSSDPATNPGRSTLESWTAADGRVWRRDVRGSHVQLHAFPAFSEGPIDFSPAGSGRLPTDPEALRRLLDARVQGSSSHNEAVFVALGDVLRMGYVPAAARAAAIEVAAGLPEVTVTRTDSETTLSFIDEEIRPGQVQALVFNSATAGLVREQTTATRDAYRFTSRIEVSEVVDALPDEVTAGTATGSGT